MDRDLIPPFKNEALREDLELANQLAGDRRFLAAWSEIGSNPELLPKVSEDPLGFLRERGVRIPERLSIKFLERLGLVEQPAPETECFTIRLFNCHSFWVSDEPGEPPKQVEVCFGLEVGSNEFACGPLT